MKRTKIILWASLCSIHYGMSQSQDANSSDSYTNVVGQYKIVDTGQTLFFDNNNPIPAPQKAEAFYGQDAAHQGLQASYTLLKENIILDNHTGLQWQRDYEVMTYTQALEKLKQFQLGGYSDWRLPSIKEAYSLIQFNGIDASSLRQAEIENLKPFIDTTFFQFKYGANGERIIDSQLLTGTIYTGLTMGRNKTAFGVNLADGRIKGYPTTSPRGDKKFMVRFVRGNINYGKNNFRDYRNGTIADMATGLMWTQDDSQNGMNWEKALKWVEQKNQEKYLGYSDWRLPNAKELQSIVDYSVSPQASQKASISSLFHITPINSEDGKRNYPFFWTSTTHQNSQGGHYAVYICFGDALGYFSMDRNSEKKWIDVHGAGAQRSDPKDGDAQNFPEGHGPQGDVVRILNFVRMVRDL